MGKEIREVNAVGRVFQLFPLWWEGAASPGSVQAETRLRVLTQHKLSIQQAASCTVESKGSERPMFMFCKAQDTSTSRLRSGKDITEGKREANTHYS